MRVNRADNTNATLWGGFAIKADYLDQVQVIMNKKRDGKSPHFNSSTSMILHLLGVNLIYYIHDIWCNNGANRTYSLRVSLRLIN